jgi:hypothetical protein
MTAELGVVLELVVAPVVNGGSQTVIMKFVFTLLFERGYIFCQSLS